MSETPARRTTRGSVRAISATPAPVVARRPRAKTPKAAPLPAVPTGTSHAYGATGKVSLFTQVDVAEKEDSFATRFGADRGAALNRDVPSISVPKSPAVVRKPSVIRSSEHVTVLVSQVTPAVARKPSEALSAAFGKAGGVTVNKAAVDDDDDDDDSDYDHDADEDGYDDDDDDVQDDDDTSEVAATDKAAYPSFTDVDTAFDYSCGPSGILIPPATPAEIEAARPWGVAVLWETILRSIQVVLMPWRQLHPRLKDLLLTLAIVSGCLFAFWSNDFDSLRDRGLNVYQQAGDIVTNSLHSTSFKLPFFGGDHDKNLYSRVSRMETDLIKLRGDRELDESAIAQLEELVPANMMVRKNKATNQWELPPNFWNALREKLAEQSSSIAWDTFIRDNQAKLDAAAKMAVDKATPDQHFVDQDMVIGHIEKSMAGLETTLRLSVTKSANFAARHAVKDLVSTTPGAARGIKQLHDLALANIVRNTELALRTVNYFSYGLGAVTIPYLCSPTHKMQQKTLWAQAYEYLPLVTPTRGYKPVNALQRWEEATDCWCAAESDDKGQAQLAVIMPRHIVPTSVTIENIPSQGTLNIGSAPKDFEVWVQDSENLLPWASEDGISLRGECGAPPAPGYVCIGNGQYNIHAPNHIQNFGLEAGQTVGVVNKVVVKVKNNWGMDYTCLYRVRFHGLSEEDGALEEAA